MPEQQIIQFDTADWGESYYVTRTGSIRGPKGRFVSPSRVEGFVLLDENNQPVAKMVDRDYATQAVFGADKVSSSVPLTLAKVQYDRAAKAQVVIPQGRTTIGEYKREKAIQDFYDRNIIR